MHLGYSPNPSADGPMPTDGDPDSPPTDPDDGAGK